MGSSFQLMASVGRRGGAETRLTLRALPLEFDYAPMSIWATQTELDVGAQGWEGEPWRNGK